MGFKSVAECDGCGYQVLAPDDHEIPDSWLAVNIQVRSVTNTGGIFCSMECFDMFVRKLLCGFVESGVARIPADRVEFDAAIVAARQLEGNE